MSEFIAQAKEKQIGPFPSYVKQSLRAIAGVSGLFLSILILESDALPPELTGKGIDDQFLFCTTRITARAKSGKKPPMLGTGYLIKEQIDEKSEVLLLVTCRHVLADFDEAEFGFLEKTKDGKPSLGKLVSVKVDLKQLAYFDPDPSVDVALIPLGPALNPLVESDTPPFVNALVRGLVPDETASAGLSTFQSVLFLGYPEGIRDEKNYLPIARRGVTATPYIVDYQGLPLFLIDAPVFPGSSGSPVFVFDQGAWVPKGQEPKMSLGTRGHFLGMLSNSYRKETKEKVEFTPVPTGTTATIPTYKQSAWLNLGVVIKAAAIFHTVDQFLKKEGLSGLEKTAEVK